jgi:D-galactose 1-dehydrogenase
LRLRLEDGGSKLLVDGVAQSCAGMGEYPSMYAHFLDLIDNRRCDMDLSPLRLVADCLLIGRHHRAAPVGRA